MFKTFKSELILFVKDTLDTLLGRREPMIPPRRLMYDGPQDVAIFKQNGAEFFRYYTELCGLQPDAAILDIGCGMGRKTIPLTHYINPQARYEGLDVNWTGVDWCRREIGSRFPNFHFQQIDVFSSRYNPGGKQQSHNYQFPFPDAQFDLAVMGSVFTHMFSDGVARYLEETSRVLKSGGQCFISYFLLNPEVEALMQQGKSHITFPIKRGDYRVKSNVQPEDAVAFDESLIRQLYARNNLEIVNVFYGAWSGRTDPLSYQDLILARKIA